MADYWKSQPKKFCDYCKCWIADNKPSIEFHERGKNHKENVAKKISEIKKKSLEKAKQEEKMSKEFAAMEEAAMKAYQEDLKRLGVKAEPVSPAPPKKPEEKREKKEKRKRETKAPGTSPGATKEWVRGFSSEGYTYYYNTISGESQWEKPEGFEDHPQVSQLPGEWVEGASEDGHTYYYNTETGAAKRRAVLERARKQIQRELSQRLGRGAARCSLRSPDRRSGGKQKATKEERKSLTGQKRPAPTENGGK